MGGGAGGEASGSYMGDQVVLSYRTAAWSGWLVVVFVVSIYVKVIVGGL